MSLIWDYKTEIGNIFFQFHDWLVARNFYKAIINGARKKFPRTSGFLMKRFDIKYPYGLQLTFGLSVCFIFLILFAGILQDLFFKDPLYYADLRIIYLFRSIITEQANHFFVFFTTLGDTLVIIAGFVLAGAYLVLNKKIRELYYLSIATAGGYGLSSLAKFIFHRSRPIEANIIKLPTSYSFPSGHAVISICFYGFILYIFLRFFKNKVLKILVSFLSLLIMLFIGISRVYLGVHYPSDVLAGWYIGFMILAFAITFSEIGYKLNFPKQVFDKKYYAIPALAIFFLFIISGYRSETMIQPQSLKIRTDVNTFLKSAPLYSETLFGEKMEPINFVVIGNEEKVRGLFAGAEWEKADPPVFKNVLKLSSAVSKNINYPNAPMTPSFYRSKTNDLGFEKATAANTARQRHHTRYWRTNYTINNQEVWVATASFDENVQVSPVQGLPIHKIDPNIDKEREFIFDDMKKTGLIKQSEKMNIVGQINGQNAFGDRFYTDGRTYIIYL